MSNWINYKLDGLTEKTPFIRYIPYGGKGFFLNKDIYQPAKYLGGNIYHTKSLTSNKSNYLPLQPTPPNLPKPSTNFQTLLK